MPLVPNFLERLLFLTLNQGPGPTLDVWAAPAFRLVVAALRLEVFDTLEGRSLRASDIALQINTDERGTAMLLETLVGLRYLKRDGDRYRNTTMTRKWLLKSAEVNLAPYLMFWGALMESRWGDFEETLRSGQPAVNLYEWIEDEPEVSRYFQEGMIALARFTGGAVVNKLTVPAGKRRLLDIGGGHATYSILFCQQYPELTATVLDSPQALRTGREAIASAELEGRIAVQAGDFLVDEGGTGYDLALIFNIIHGFSPETNTTLFRRALSTLKPGGQVVVMEQLSDGGGPLPMATLITRILGMSYYHLLGGQLYSFEVVAGWLTAAGFVDIRRKNLLQVGSSLIFATRPG
jgi:hypothetical protein